MDSKLDAHLEAAAKELPGLAATIVDSSGKQLYHKAFGTTNLTNPSAAAYTTSTPTALWSCTKLVASIAALQLIEQGKLSLDDLAEKYVPEIAGIPVLDTSNKDANGNYTTRPAKTKPTVLQLMTHTSGFSYDFFSKDTLDWELQNNKPPHGYMALAIKDVFKTPLVFEPGTRYEYGISIDWLGFIVEAISGQKLNKYVEQNILKPLSMDATTDHFLSDDRMIVHHRMDANTIVGNPDMKMLDESPVYGGGHYLVGTLDDYSKLLSTILNKGKSPATGAQILKPETVELIFQDFMPEATKNSAEPDKATEPLGAVPSASPALTHSGRFFPGEKLGWSCGLMLNLNDIPGGRKAYSGMWAGMGNLYYWIDPKSDRAGMIMTSLLPFFDEKVLALFADLESVAYGGEVGGLKTFSAPL
jgi:methyl acetate hydrolase